MPFQNEDDEMNHMVITMIILISLIVFFICLFLAIAVGG
jgi:hypothetical protein